MIERKKTQKQTKYIKHYLIFLYKERVLLIKIHSNK
jgi:hypothetical protein